MTNNFERPEQMMLALSSLGDALRIKRISFSCVVAGGAALAAIGRLHRPTTDIDVVASRGLDGTLVLAPSPLPDDVRRVVEEIRLDLGLASDWLNSVMAKGYRAGLPEGWDERLTWQQLGGLELSFLHRDDLIPLKLEAASDRAPELSKHLQDLRALEVSREELERAAIWVRAVNVDPECEARLTWVAQHVFP
jgi:hypothetical protein